MKKWLAILLAGVMMMTAFVGCGEETPNTPEEQEPEVVKNAYADVKTTDCWGEKTVAVLGDSISFGAGCKDSISDNSYVGILRKAFNKENESTNYGFVSSYPTNWGNPRSEEITPWPTMTGGPGVQGNPSGWKEDDNGEFLGKMGMTAYQKGATITYKLSEGYRYDYICVYYRSADGHGSFSVGTGEGADYRALTSLKGDTVYDCQNATAEVKRTDFYAMSDMTDGLTICLESDKEVGIAGIGYYNDISGEKVTFNNYSRGGLMFCEVSDKALDQAASAGTLILGVGYNDVFWGYMNGYYPEDFTDRVDYLIEAVNKNGTKLIVNNYIWDNPETRVNPLQEEMLTHCHAELKRLAEETNGILVDQNAVWGDKIITEVNNGDGVHPTDAGHEMMAQAILEAIGLAEGEA